MATGENPGQTLSINHWRTSQIRMHVLQELVSQAYHSRLFVTKKERRQKPESIVKLHEESMVTRMVRLLPIY